jgi:beta-glucanase (GH16 family)
MKTALLFIFVWSVTCFAQTQKRTLVWEENFNGTTLDESVWNFELGDGCPNLCGWGNKELQTYTNTNHEVLNGKLTIQAKKEGDLFTSSRITTKVKKEFKYGRIEARAKLASGVGLWPAFWLLGSNISNIGWPKCGEIDILEHVGKEPNLVYTTVHTQESHGNSINTQKTIFPTIQDGFHVYAIDWTEDKIDFFVDEKLVYTYGPELKNENSWPFNQPFYIIINLAIGGNFGGPEVDETMFPESFIIDYVKVFQ